MDLMPNQAQAELAEQMAALVASHAELGIADLVQAGPGTAGFPEATGGSGGGVSEQAVVAYVLGRRSVTTTYHNSIVLTGAVLASADPRGPGLAALLAGRSMSTCIGELPWEAPDTFRPPSAVEHRGTLVVDGVARFVAGAGTAQDLLVVLGGHTLVTVAADAPGVTLVAVPVVDGTSFHVGFHGVPVDPAQVIDGPHRAHRWLPQALAVGRTVLAAEMVGAASAALEHATAWAQERRQFGVPVGAFQAVQHQLADAAIDVVTARDAVADAAGTLDRGDANAVVAAAEAKLLCAAACRRVTAAAHQVCGGEGLYADQPLHRWHRRVQGLVPLLGSPATLRAEIAEALLGPGAPPGPTGRS